MQALVACADCQCCHHAQPSLELPLSGTCANPLLQTTPDADCEGEAQTLSKHATGSETVRACHKVTAAVLVLMKMTVCACT